jgi:hypothetical protein
MDAVVGKFWREFLSRDGIFSFTGVVLVSRLDDRSRMTRECHVRICGGLGGKFPGATRHPQPAAAARWIVGVGLAGGGTGFIHGGHRLLAGGQQCFNRCSRYSNTFSVIGGISST